MRNKFVELGLVLIVSGGTAVFSVGAAGLRGSGALPAAVDDLALRNDLLREAQAWAGRDEIPKLPVLRRQLRDRRRCDLALPQVNDEPEDTAEPQNLWRRGVVVVARLYDCGKCDRKHVALTSGFLVSRDGALVTNYHVVDHEEGEGLVVMTEGHKVFPVVEVLAADPAADVAILRAQGEGFRPAPLGEPPAVGESIRVMSHPGQRLFVLTEGIVSRYYRQRRRGRDLTLMAITAEFGKGSSGAPVFDASGRVVAVVRSTQTVFADGDQPEPRRVQMVHRECVPIHYVLNLIGAP